MKICILTHDFPPVIGGAQTHQYNEAKKLSEFGHKVQVITGTPTPDLKDIDYSKENFNLIRLEGLKEFSKGKIGIKEIIPSLFKTVKEFNPDIIHAHGYIPFLGVCFFIKSIRAKVFFTYHATPKLEYKRAAGVFDDFELDKSFGEFIFQYCPYEKLIACSRYYYSWAKSCGAPPSKLKLVYYGVDFDKFLSATPLERKRIGFSKDDFIICSPGRMIPSKGVVDLIELLVFLPPNFKLFLPTSISYTKPEFKEQIMNLVKRRALENRINILADTFNVFDMPAAYKMSDLVVLASHVEGLGLVLIEGIAAKKPVIGTAVPGITEVVNDGRTGLLAQPHNPKSLANAIMKLYKDRTLRKQLIEGAYLFARKKFDLTAQTKKIEKLFLDSLKK
ncbi:MAG: glycosyltransferase family 4 protein [Patescibacteria group bacterium]